MTRAEPQESGTCPEPQDAGITLVELIVYVAVAALFLGLVAGIFAAGLGAEAHTRDRDTATGKAQVISETLQTSIRNANDFRVEAGGTAVRARVAVDANGWECRAWVMTAAGDMLYRRDAALIDLAGVGASVPGALPIGWTSLVDADLSDTKLAAKVGGSFSGTLPQLNYDLTVTTGDAVTPLAGGVSAQAKSEGTVLSCW